MSCPLKLSSYAYASVVKSSTYVENFQRRHCVKILIKISRLLRRNHGLGVWLFYSLITVQYSTFRVEFRTRTRTPMHNNEH